MGRPTGEALHQPCGFPMNSPIISAVARLFAYSPLTVVNVTERYWDGTTLDVGRLGVDLCDELRSPSVRAPAPLAVYLWD